MAERSGAWHPCYEALAKILRSAVCDQTAQDFCSLFYQEQLEEPKVRPILFSMSDVQRF